MLHRIFTLWLSAVMIMPGAGLYFAATPRASDNREPATGSEPASLVIRKRAAEVRLVFTVEDGHKPVKDVTPEQLRVLDDGLPVPALTSFAQDSDFPLHVGLLVDRSDSMHEGFSAERQAARGFLERVLRPNLDSVFLMDFSATLSVLELTSGNLQPISNRVATVKAGGLTALYDVLLSASTTMTNDPGGKPGRRVIILLSDGEDNYSRHSLPDAVGSGTAGQHYDLCRHGP